VSIGGIVLAHDASRHGRDIKLTTELRGLSCSEGMYQETCPEFDPLGDNANFWTVRDYVTVVVDESLIHQTFGKETSLHVTVHWRHAQRSTGEYAELWEAPLCHLKSYG
jgi:hypothetical protein